MNSEDLVAAGFKRLDPELIDKKPPMISWGMLYQNMGWEAKIKYLERLASSMNHAAHKIQGERNELGRLCKLKEEQLTKLNDAMQANNEMVQTEVTKMNTERQSFNEAVAILNRKIRDLRREIANSMRACT